MSRLEKAPSTGETNTMNTATTKTSSHSQQQQQQHQQQQHHHHQQNFPRITVPKGSASAVNGEGTLVQMVDKNGNALDPKLVEGHAHEIVWARKQILQRKKGSTIPSNLAIPVGLAQIAIGASMAILGVLAIRYQSYLFYYGSGLWTGMVVGITGALCAMCTKSGLPKPKWFCGGQRWQVHVLLAMTMLSLSASVLLAIFSTAGLLQTAKTMVGVDMADKTNDDETLDRRRSAGNVINSLLLLSSMLEVLLSFSTFGMAISVLCKSNYKASLLSSTGSSGSENQVARGEAIATNTEYQARKDRLLRWLGHQPRRSVFPGLPQPRGNYRPYVIPAQSVSSSYLYPASHRPVFTLPPNYPTSITIPHPGYSIIMPMPAPTHMPIVPLPMRRPTTPAAASHHGSHGAHHHPHHPHHHPHSHQGTLLLVPEEYRMKHQLQQIQQQHHAAAAAAAANHRSRHSSVSNLSVATRRSSKCSVASSSTKLSVQRRICEETNKELEITEEEVSKTYTGLDRSVAEDFIVQSMHDGNNNVHNNMSNDTSSTIASTEESVAAAGGDEQEIDEEEVAGDDERDPEEEEEEEDPEHEISRL